MTTSETQHRVKHNKKALLDALEKTLGVVTTACQLSGVPRGNYYRYYNADKKFAAKVDELCNVTLDFVETQLHKRIRDSDTTAMIFYLKTKGKSRGYIEKQIVEHEGALPIVVQTNKDKKALEQDY